MDAPPRRKLPVIPAIAAVAVVYYLTARLGLHLAIPGTNATPVWPPSGLAFAAVLLLGSRIWPGIALGAFAANVATFLAERTGPASVVVPVSAAIAFGNTLEALTGAYLLRRWGYLRNPFESSRAVFRFLGAALAMCLVSAALGPAAEASAGLIRAAGLPKIGFTWWLGDVTGILTLTPLAWAWTIEPPKDFRSSRLLEGGALLTMLLAFGLARFGGLASAGSPYPVFPVMLPLFVWAAFRFRLPVAAATIALAAGFAIWGAAGGEASASLASITQVQLYVGVVAATMLVMSALLEDRRRVEEAVRELNLRLEGRVRQRTLELEAANKELEGFGYSIAHDLKAPLRSIESFSRMLQEEYGSRLDERGVDLVRRVRGACGRMSRLIEGLLQLSVSLGRPLRVEAVDLGLVAREILERRQKSEPSRRVQWRAAEGLNVQGDPELIATVIENLLDNAWKFTKGRDPAVIEFGVERRPEGEVYFVRDNGVGFEATQAARLFQIFERLHSAEEFPGTGIGLAQVQRLLRRYGGKAWGEGSPSSGAVFYFTLPGEGQKP